MLFRSAFSKVSDDDIKAIYAYLKSLTPVKYTPPSNGLMFSQRWGMMFWNALFFKNERFQPNPQKSEQINRGAYLSEGLGHCSSCHSPRNIFMAEQVDQSYAGSNFLLDEVAEGKVRKWSAPNLSPAKGGLEKWSASDIVKYLKTGFTVSRAGVWGPMNDVVLNSTSKMTDEDLQAMAAYLKDLPPREVKGKVPEDQAKAGQALYRSEEHTSELQSH